MFDLQSYFKILLLQIFAYLHIESTNPLNPYWDVSQKQQDLSCHERSSKLNRVSYCHSAITFPRKCQGTMTSGFICKSFPRDVVFDYTDLKSSTKQTCTIGDISMLTFSNQEDRGWSDGRHTV